MNGLSILLLEKYGVIVGGNELIRLLGYSSTDAFRQAYSRHRLPVNVFNITHRKGKFAYTFDVANWLESLRVPPTDGEKPNLRENKTRSQKNND